MIRYYVNDFHAFLICPNMALTLKSDKEKLTHKDEYTCNGSCVEKEPWLLNKINKLGFTRVVNALHTTDIV